METYLGSSDEDNVSDDVALAIMRNTVVNMRRLLTDDQRMCRPASNLMWDSAMAENGILKVGRLTRFPGSSDRASAAVRIPTAITDRDWRSSILRYYRHIVKDAPEKVRPLWQRGVPGGRRKGKRSMRWRPSSENAALPTPLSELRSSVTRRSDAALLREVADSCNIIQEQPAYPQQRLRSMHILRECLQ